MTNRDAVPSLTRCAECGMHCTPGEFHPYAACLLFRACGNATEVRAHIEALRAPTAEQADAVRVGSETWNVLRLCITELSGWMRDHGQDLRSQDAVKRARALLAAPASSTGDHA